MTQRTKLGITAAASLLILGAIIAVWKTPHRESEGDSLSRRSGIAAFSDTPFTADMTIVSAAPGFHAAKKKSPVGSPENAPLTYQGTIYAGANALRTDIEMASGATASVIVRYDNGLAWILTPGQHYMEVPIQAQTDLLTVLRDKNARIEKQDLGPENVGVYPCEKYHVQVAESGRRLSGWIWVGRATPLAGFIVKAQDEASKEAVVLSRIQLGAPPPSVFDLPAGYHRLTPSRQ